MMRWPTCAIFSLTPGPIAATTPQGSWPPMTGFGLTGSPPIASPPDFGRRYWWRSLPHMPEAFISTTTSPGPGVGSGNSISSISRSPLKTTPRIASSTFLEAYIEETAYALSAGDATGAGPRKATRRATRLRGGSPDADQQAPSRISAGRYGVRMVDPARLPAGHRAEDPGRRPRRRAGIRQPN